ncbi:MAG: thiamine pyrophosphate-binding protein [Chloroflexi bacterium]|nr:thiamine pyrophosphate-binding protein [Chloroflexota bacterium]
MTGAEILVAMLQAHGVDTIFGLPGDTGVAFYDALRDQSQIRHVMTRDERSAAFMADAYARLSDKPGVCEGPSGGGATYILPGVAEAHHSSVPLLVITSDNALSMEHQGALTALDQEALFRPVTKWSAAVKRAGLIPHMLRRAFRLMTTGRCGAVHLSFPKDILDKPVEVADIYADPACAHYPSYRTRPDSAMVARAAEKLASAARPVMICGGGIHAAHAYAEVQALAELLNMPVATSINGKGSIAETHPLAIGVAGANGGRAFTHDFIRESDLILFAGTRVNYVTSNDWTVPPRDYRGAIIQIDVDGGEIGNNLPVTAGLQGDAQMALRDLIDALRGCDSTSRAAVRERIARATAAYWSGEAAKQASDARPVRPHRIMRELLRNLPADAVIVADPGTATPFVAAQYPLAQAGRRTVIPRAHGGLGYALPASLGASYARPDQTIVCLTGDGSFGFSVGELETIARMNRKIVVIQFNNGAFGWIKELQHLHHGDRFFGVDFLRQDCAAIARGFGWLGIRVEDPRDFEPALQEGLSASTPAFIDVVSADQILETPPVIGWQVAEQRRAQAG